MLFPWNCHWKISFRVVIIWQQQDRYPLHANTAPLSSQCTEFSFFFSFFSLSPHSLLVWSIGRPTAVSISFPQNWLVWSDTFCMRVLVCDQQWSERTKKKKRSSFLHLYRDSFASSLRNYVEFTSVRWELSSGNHRRRCLFAQYVTFEFLSFGCFTLLQWPLQCERFLVSFVRSRTVFFSSTVNLCRPVSIDQAKREENILKLW